MEGECNCKSYVLCGIIQHQSDCASWDDEQCGYCGAPAKELFEVEDRGKRINVCEPCYDNDFTV